MARITAERWKQKTTTLVQVTPALSQKLDPNPAWTCPVRASRRSCHQGNITDPCFCFHYIVHSFHIFKRCICNCRISTLRVALSSGSHHIRYEQQLTEVQRLAHEGLKAASCQTEPGEKNRDEPQWPCLTPLRSGQGHLDLSRLILTSSQTHRISIKERPMYHSSLSNGSGIY